MTRHWPVDVPGWPRPKGYSNGVLAGPGRLLFVAGQIGWDEQERLVSDLFLPQFRRALENVVAVVRAAGGAPDDVCRVTIFVKDKTQYTADLKAVGLTYREVMGRTWPAMSLVEVRDLLEPGALVEIEATAVIPSGGAT
jgi:enamine deaminase RidA (YjgF/YER057c/UK114 family)